MKGKLERAEVLINRICKFNKIPFPSDVWDKLKKNWSVEYSDTQARQRYSLMDLFRTSHIRQRTLILFYLWFAISTSYYGLTFQMTSFKGSRYLTFFTGGAVETAAYALTLPVMKMFGRKKPLLACFIGAAVMCVAAGVFSNYYKDLTNVTIGLALVGRCVVAGLFGIIFVYTSEIYPTVIRNIGMGACCVWARAGGVIAPQINQWTKTLWGVDAVFIFGAMVLVAGVFIFLLPETYNTQLPDSLKQAEGVPSKEVEVQNPTECKATAIAGWENEAEGVGLLREGNGVKSTQNVDENEV